MTNLIPISDHPILKLKRKVEWTAFIYSDREAYVKLFTICHHYSNNEDKSYGDPFSSNAIKDFEKILIANNTKMVNPLNGVGCKPDENGIFTDFLGNKVDNPMGQFDFFKLLVTNKTINILAIIESNIIQEDQYFNSYN